MVGRAYERAHALRQPGRLYRLWPQRLDHSLRTDRAESGPRRKAINQKRTGSLSGGGSYNSDNGGDRRLLLLIGPVRTTNLSGRGRILSRLPSSGRIIGFDPLAFVSRSRTAGSVGPHE